NGLIKWGVIIFIGAAKFGLQRRFVTGDGPKGVQENDLEPRVARWSRLRKKNHLDGLMARVAELRNENQQILTGLNATTQNYMSVESDNAILRAQMAELSHRLQSLDEIVSFVSTGSGNGNGNGGFMAHPEPLAYGMADLMAGFGNSYWNCLSQPIMMAILASALANHGFFF
ncbi:ocs element-binding factor 1, partial [Phtheirospermum japonicum]